MVLELLGVAFGFALLARSADHLVRGAARVARRLDVSPIVVGAVVIGFGTSAPELLISGLAAAQGSLDIAVGNVVGSNVANLTLVLGVAGLIVPLSLSSATLRREAPLSAASVVLLAAVLALGDDLTRLDGTVLALAMAVALVVVVRGARGGDELSREVDEFLAERPGRRVQLGTEVGRTLLGLAGTLAGAQLLVWGAKGVADGLGFSEGFVGLTLVAVGTSLPELVTAVHAARQREDDLIIGNLLGSNLFNSLGVGAAAGLVGGGPVADPDLVRAATVLMVVVALGAWAFMRTGRVVARWEAGTLLVIYAVTLPLLSS